MLTKNCSSKQPTRDWNKTIWIMKVRIKHMNDFRVSNMQHKKRPNNFNQLHKKGVIKQVLLNDSNPLKLSSVKFSNYQPKKTIFEANSK